MMIPNELEYNALLRRPLPLGQSVARRNLNFTRGLAVEDDSRSSWDILWSCVSTIFACTWAALHENVPARNESLFRAGVRKSFMCFVALMAPEITSWVAVQQLWLAKSTRDRCNSSQTNRDRQTKEPTSYRRAPALEHAGGNKLDPVNTQWSLAQCFCIIMGGVALQTEDDWTYIIEQRNAHTLIEAGFIRSSDFRDRDVEDRSKADSFAKAFTVVQSLWTLINIISRAAYDLPISPIELLAVSYVACGLITYACWWCKPKDMCTPITIMLRCARDDLPKELADITDARPQYWVHLRAVPLEENMWSLPKMLQQWGASTFGEETSRAPMGESAIGPRVRVEMMMDAFAFLAAGLFCGTHLAAWNFPFPTQTEQTAWRVFSLVSLSLAAFTYIHGQTPLVARLLAGKVSLPSWLKKLANSDLPFTRLELYVAALFELAYAFSRLGVFALTIASLRALPARSFVSVSSVSSIPHY
ncbi:hypothetical protein B0T10DRAFT_461791 [Thelonectria olida]|uniref:Uncharacterized protein n=1 Tax=Thelonectria olida TaxID=1576542 RepID=A0A9P8W3K6_9HYPO|nr:hypothetical protein B0T10DRAFT_461791 [Thelonectria olida]